MVFSRANLTPEPVQASADTGLAKFSAMNNFNPLQKGEGVNTQEDQLHDLEEDQELVDSRKPL